MSRARFIRSISVTASVALIALQAFISPAAAGDTRIVFIGSGATDGALSLTPVSSGQLTLVDVVVQNNGKQTLTSATLTMGAAPATPFPDGVAAVHVLGANASSCTIADGALTCAFGNLARDTSRSISVILTMANPGLTAVDATVKVAEQVNDKGANRDTFVASGSVMVSETGCDNRATFVPPGQAAKIGTSDASCGGQSTILDIPAHDAGNVVQVAEVASNRCVPNRSCFGEESVAFVNAGAALTPYLTWTILWEVVPKNYNPRSGVVHFLDNGTPDDPSDDTAVVIPNTKQNACSASRIFDCVVSWTPVGDGGIMIVQTETNGAMRG